MQTEKRQCSKPHTYKKDFSRKVWNVCDYDYVNGNIQLYITYVHMHISCLHCNLFIFKVIVALNGCYECSYWTDCCFRAYPWWFEEAWGHKVVFYICCYFHIWIAFNVTLMIFIAITHLLFMMMLPGLLWLKCLLLVNKELNSWKEPMWLSRRHRRSRIKALQK